MSANATAPIVNKVVLERLADNLEELDDLVWADAVSTSSKEVHPAGDVARIRELAGESLMLTLSLLEDG